jgi:hypothetical protein
MVVLYVFAYNEQGGLFYTLTMQYSVAILIGTSSSDFRRLSDSMAVWAPDTPEIRFIAEGIWAKRAALGQLPSNELTLYKFNSGESPETTFMDLLATVDLHHGEYSHDPPWTILTVYGVELSPAIKEALVEYGDFEFTFLPDGFTAKRPMV